jgi:hypothetical protein
MELSCALMSAHSMRSQRLNSLQFRCFATVGAKRGHRRGAGDEDAIGQIDAHNLLADAPFKLWDAQFGGLHCETVCNGATRH